MQIDQWVIDSADGLNQLIRFKDGTTIYCNENYTWMEGQKISNKDIWEEWTSINKYEGEYSAFTEATKAEYMKVVGHSPEPQDW